MRWVLLASALVVALCFMAGCSEPEAETLKTPSPGESKNAQPFGAMKGMTGGQAGAASPLRRSLGRRGAGQ